MTGSEPPVTQYQRREALLHSPDATERLEGQMMVTNEHLRALRGAVSFIAAAIAVAICLGIVGAFLASSESSGY